MTVRGVMGYEGHLMMVNDREEKKRNVRDAMSILALAHEDVGGDIVSAGGTGTYDMFAGTTVNEVQAGSYTLMDTQYAQLGIPFVQAMWVVGTVISSNNKWSVIDVGLKSSGWIMAIQALINIPYGFARTNTSPLVQTKALPALKLATKHLWRRHTLTPPWHYMKKRTSPIRSARLLPFGQLTYVVGKPKTRANNSGN